MLSFTENIQLYNFPDVPEVQQFNPYVLSGYRAYLLFPDCIRSVMMWSNELLNVWSHVFSFFIFTYLLMYDQLCILPDYNCAMVDHIILFIFYFCCQICMLCSSYYHTFLCHQERTVVEAALSIDLVGITTGILGCYIAGLYYSLYCYKQLRAFYMIFCPFVIFFTTGVMMSNPDYRSDSGRPLRIVHNTMIILMGICPFVNLTFIAPTSEIGYVIPGIVNFYLILAVALFFFVSKFPERCFPGRFDFIGQSHTIWHVIITLALLYFRRFILNLFEYRSNSQCL